MKRLSVFLVLVLTLGTIFALTSCGCEASNQTDQNGQTSTPNENTNNGSTNNGSTSNGNAGTNHGNANDGLTNDSTHSNNGSLTNDVIDGGEDIMDGVVEGGKDVVDGVDDAITGNHNNNTTNGTANNGISSDLPTYEDMLRNGRVRD